MMDHLAFPCIYNELKWMDDRRNAHIARSLRRRTIDPYSANSAPPLVHASLTPCSQIHCFIIIANLPITPLSPSYWLQQGISPRRLHPTSNWVALWPLPPTPHLASNVAYPPREEQHHSGTPVISFLSHLSTRSSGSLSPVSNRLPFLPLNTFCSSSS